MKRVLSHACLGLAVTAGVAILADQGRAQAQERCYGIARAGSNDGVGASEAPGSSKVNFQGDAWVMVARGTCLTTPLPVQPDGTPRRGSLQPLERDLP